MKNSHFIKTTKRTLFYQLTVITIIFFCIDSCSVEDHGTEPGNHTQTRLSQIQVIGSHNSYKKAIDPSLMSILKQDDPETARALDYQHLPIKDQLNLGLRILELDVYYDPEGGRYAEPAGLKTVLKRELPPGPDYDPEGVMLVPGFKVLHVQDIDFRSHAYSFKQALYEIRTWSSANINHIPIVITINAKDSVIEDHPEFVKPLAFDEEAFGSLEQEILEVFKRREVLVPDDVRGNFSSLEQAVLSNNWPSLDDVRGKYLFVLDEQGPKSEVYIRNHPSLRDRIMFVNALEGTPEAAFRIVNEPIEDGKYIHRLVKAGYLVRTRADADTVEARTGDTTRRQAAFESGAHFISTDYYLPNPEFHSGYQVRFPNGRFSRWNPVTSERGLEVPIDEN